MRDLIKHDSLLWLVVFQQLWLVHFDPCCSLSDLLPRRTAVAQLSCCCVFDRGHPRFWNFYSTIPVDVVRVKSYMNWLFDPARVVIRVTINKLYFVSEWLLSGVVNMIWNGGGLGTGESDVLIMLFNCVSHRSSSFSDVQLAALTFTFIERQQTHICSCSRGYGIKEQKKSQKNVVYFLSARGKSWNKNSQKRKSLKNYSFKYELEITFLLIFYA